MAIIFFIFLFIFIGLPAQANFDAGDAQEVIDAQFGRGKVISVAVDNGQIVRLTFDKGLQPEEKKAIEDFSKTIDMQQEGRQDVQKHIEVEKQAIADDTDLTDAQHAELKAKLERAAVMSDLQAKKAKLEEAQQAKADAKTESKINLELRPVRPRLTRLPHVGETYAEYKRTSP